MNLSGSLNNREMFDTEEDIVGVLVLESKKLHGHTKKGLPIYSFIPLSNKYPRFFVPSSYKDRRNILAVIRFTRLEGEHPMGTCVRVLGPVDDRDIYDYALLLKNNLGASIKPLKIKDETNGPTVSDPLPLPIYRNITVIDPDGSTDRDDGFHIIKERGATFLYVHIADVDHYVPANGDMDVILKERVTSIYSLNNVYHMLPEKYACDIISLIGNGAERRVLTTVFKITDSQTQPQVFLNVHPAIVTVNRNTSFTYEEAQASLGKTEQIKWLSEITGETDTHKMVERIMIWTNSAIAEFNYRHGYNFSVYYPLVEVKSVRSTYSTEDHGHGMMGLDHYTHFTSPIRRYADIVVHRIVKAILYQTPLSMDLTAVRDSVNVITNRAKDYYRNQAFLKLIDKLPKDGTSVSSPCTVIELTEPNYITIHLKDYNIFLNTTLFARELIGIRSISDFKISVNDNINASLVYLPSEIRLHKKILVTFNL
jgi:exoribonuclease R